MLPYFTYSKKKKKLCSKYDYLFLLSESKNLCNSQIKYIIHPHINELYNFYLSRIKKLYITIIIINTILLFRNGLIALD